MEYLELKKLPSQQLQVMRVLPHELHKTFAGTTTGPVRHLSSGTARLRLQLREPYEIGQHIGDGVYYAGRYESNEGDPYNNLRATIDFSYASTPITHRELLRLREELDDGTGFSPPMVPLPQFFRNLPFLKDIRGIEAALDELTHNVDIAPKGKGLSFAWLDKDSWKGNGKAAVLDLNTREISRGRFKTGKARAFIMRLYV